jgi:hypothetical protein
MGQLFAEYPLLLLGLEAGIALFLLIFIVLWTASGALRKKPRQSVKPESAEKL